jgi:hypothetical protein
MIYDCPWLYSMRHEASLGSNTVTSGRMHRMAEVVRESACVNCDQIIYRMPSDPLWVTNPQAADTWRCGNANGSGPAHQPRARTGDRIELDNGTIRGEVITADDDTHTIRWATGEEMTYRNSVRWDD